MLEQLVEMLTGNIEALDTNITRVATGTATGEEIDEMVANFHNLYMLLAEEGLIKPTVDRKYLEPLFRRK